MAVEDTPDHRRIFGADGECVRFFKSPSELSAVVSGLLEHEEERHSLAAEAHLRVTEGHHTYRDRLETILQTAGLG
jgi:spore maturation protein CgeB